MDSEAPAAARERLLSAGLALLLERGYHGVGVQELLDAAQAQKGSFYHHFRDKEDFALQVVDAYMAGVHQVLDDVLADSTRPPLDRVKGFFEVVAQGYGAEGYLGCLLGGLGQELAGASPVFAQRIAGCLDYIAGRLAEPLEEARVAGDLQRDVDVPGYARHIVDCWEGAALRSRLTRDSAPLTAMLGYLFAAETVPR